MRFCCLSREATGVEYGVETERYAGKQDRGKAKSEFAHDRVVAYHANFVTGVKEKLLKMGRLPIEGQPLGGLGGCYNHLQEYDRTNAFAAHFVQTARESGIDMPV
jgi:hypothetical protein